MRITAQAGKQLLCRFLYKAFLLSMQFKFFKYFGSILKLWFLLNELLKVELLKLFNFLKGSIINEFLCKEIKPFFFELFYFVNDKNVIFVFWGRMKLKVNGVNRFMLIFQQLWEVLKLVVKDTQIVECFKNLNYRKWLAIIIIHSVRVDFQVLL